MNLLSFPIGPVRLYRKIPLLLAAFFTLVVLTACSAKPTDDPTLISEEPTAQSVIPTHQPSPTAQAPTPTVVSSGIPTLEEKETVPVNCTAPASLTPASTEGPYFTVGSPERANLIDPGMPGNKLVLSGYVLTSDCQPISNTKIDFWQADANGVYDNSGYTLRGHQFTDENGFYQLTTVIPGEYPGRTEHIHYKVLTPEGKELTSQLYFPESSLNQGDTIFNPALLIEIFEEGESVKGRFNLIMEP